MMKLDVVLIILYIASIIVCIMQGAAAGAVMNCTGIAICVYNIIEMRDKKKGDKR